MPMSLVFINGERCRDFHDVFLEDGTLKEYSIKELEEILKKRNFILDDVVILKGEEAREKYRKGFVAFSDWIEIVYELHAHPVNQEGEIFEVVPQMPSFPGGDEALMTFIKKNIRYPERMLQTGIHGKVVVSYIIGKDGTILEPEIVNNLLKDKSGNPCTKSTINKLCEQEALRIIKMMPQWLPGINDNGESVRVRLNVPVIFNEKQ